MIYQGGTGAKTQADSPYPVTILSTNLSSRGKVGAARERGSWSQVARIHPWTLTTFVFSLRTEQRSARAFSPAMIVLSDKLWQSAAEAEEREAEW